MTRNRPLRYLSLLLAGVFVTHASGEERGTHPATEPLPTLTKPLAHTLDFPTFNPAEGEKTDQIIGEILSLIDEFLTAQGITSTGTLEDLERLYCLA